VISTPGQTTPPRVPVTLSGAPASETVTSSQGVAAGVLRGTPTSPGLGFGPVAPPGAGAAGVVVASEVGPAEVAAFDGAVAALATAGGAPLSHASILARSMGIPAVTGLGPDLLAVPPGTPVLVDGDEGSVRIRPTPAEVDAARARWSSSTVVTMGNMTRSGRSRASRAMARSWVSSRPGEERARRSPRLPRAGLASATESHAGTSAPRSRVRTTTGRSPAAAATAR
jgi:phosphohistidine swiveling domain-containing protein